MFKAFIIAFAVAFTSHSAFAQYGGNDMMVSFMQCDSVQRYQNVPYYTVVFSAGGIAYHVDADFKLNPTRGMPAKSKVYFLKQATTLIYTDHVLGTENFSITLKAQPLLGRNSDGLVRVKLVSGYQTIQTTCRRLALPR